MILSLIGIAFLGDVDDAAQAYPSPPDCVEVVSRTATVPPGNGSVFSTKLSAGGRIVAFDTTISNFGVADTNVRRDVYVRDLQTGAVELVSVRADGQQSSGDSDLTAISADGRFVAFQNQFGDVVDGPVDAGGGFYLRDRQQGTTILVSLRPNGSAALLESGSPGAMSNDGRFVTFYESEFDPTNGFVRNLYLRDNILGSTQVMPRGIGFTFGNQSRSVYLAGDGSSVTYLIDSGSGWSHLFRFHTATSVVENLYDFNGLSFIASSDGRYVVLTHTPRTTQPFEPAHPAEVYFLDTLAGSSNRLTALDGQSISHFDGVSAGGRLVLYYAGSGLRVLDRSNGEIRPVGRDIGFAPNSTTMSDDGRYLASTSSDYGGAAVVVRTLRPQLGGGPFFVPRGGRASVVIYGEGLDATMAFSVDSNPFIATAVAPGPDSHSVIVTFAVPKNTPTIDYRLHATTADGCTAEGSSMLVVSDGGEFIAEAPQRILDTRSGDALQPGETRSVPRAGASGLVLNVTVTEPTGVGYLTVFPIGSTRPIVSSINFTPGQTVANLVIIGTDSGGFNIYNSGGSTHVVVDEMGVFAGPLYRHSFQTTSGRYVALSPTRILDTRLDPRAKVPGDVYLTLPFRRDLGITGALFNLTAAEPETNGYFVAWPPGQSFPPTSNLNFAPGVTVANLIAVGTGGPSNAVNLGNVGGPAHMIADLQGVFTSNGEGDRFQEAANPFRVLDTRSGLGVTAAGPVPANGENSVDLRGHGVPDEASAVVMNVTVNRPTAVSYLTVWPSGSVRPTASNINFIPDQTVANAVVVPIGPDGRIKFYNAFGNTHILADVMGWFT